MSELPEDQPDPVEETAQEPSVTNIPDDIEIPQETPYGDNKPVQNQDQPQQKTQKPQKNKETTQRKTTKIPAAVFFPTLLALLTAAFLTGKMSQEKPTPKTQENQNPQPRKKLTNFIQDKGLYKKEKTIDSTFMLEARLEMAKNNIFIITGNPANPKLIAALSRKKEHTGIPIYIITGKDTPEEESLNAKEAGFPVYRIETTLERPYSIVIIDNKLVMDISRNNWFWESSEKEVVESTKKWASEIIKNATIE